MREESKNVILGILIVSLGISGVGNFILNALRLGGVSTCCPGEVLKIAITTNPGTRDPFDSQDWYLWHPTYWSSAYNDMVSQMLETLIAYDLTDPDFPLVGRLAESWYWTNNKTITFQLRENVFFHDGSQFTAECVLHTIKRINYFCNLGMEAQHSLYQIETQHSLYKFADGKPIFNDTLSFKTDDYNVTLVLNRPYGPVEDLLAYTVSSIYHPNSTPVDELLDLTDEMVIGTGPFKLESYVPNSEIRLERWERYWSTGAYWDTIVYIYYDDAITANNAMLAGEIDYLGQGIASLKPDFEADPDITVTGDGTSDFVYGTTYDYILFRSDWINKTWRKAICHAFNYSYLIKEIQQNTVVRANSFIPPSFPGHNSSIVPCTYNIPYARQILQSMGYGFTNGTPWDRGIQVGDDFSPGVDEALWTAAEFIPNSGDFTDNEWKFSLQNVYRHSIELLFARFVYDMDFIGIKVGTSPGWWDEWPPPSWIFEKNHFAWFSINPSYFDGFNIINLLMYPRYAWDEFIMDYLRIDNNTEINNIITQTIAETSVSQRNEYYKKLQYIIHDKYLYHIPLFYNKVYFVHISDLKGIPYNPMRSLYWYPTYRE